MTAQTTNALRFGLPLDGGPIRIYAAWCASRDEVGAERQALRDAGVLDPDRCLDEAGDFYAAVASLGHLRLVERWADLSVDPEPDGRRWPPAVDRGERWPMAVHDGVTGRDWPLYVTRVAPWEGDGFVATMEDVEAAVREYAARA